MWIGDVPFFYRGHMRIAPVNAQIPGGTWDVIDLMGQFAVLGSVSSFVIPKNPIIFTRKGRKSSLRTGWPSERPVRLKFLERGRKVLAVAPNPGKVRAEDILPQQSNAEEKSSTVPQIVVSGQLFDAVTNIGAGVALLMALAISFVGQELSTLSVQQVLSALLYCVVMVLLFVNGIGKSLGNRFASAWVGRFGKKGEFVRIWDYSNPRMDPSMLDELLHIASSGR